MKDTVVVKKLPPYMDGYEGFYTVLRPTPRTTKEMMDAFKINPSNDSAVLFNNGKGRTPVEKLKGMKFFCVDLVVHNSDSYLMLQNQRYDKLYYKIKDRGDFALNTLEMQKASDELDNTLDRIKQESDERRANSKAFLSKLVYGPDKNYYYKKNIHVNAESQASLLNKAKAFFKDFTQTTEGPVWEQIKGSNSVVGAVSIGRTLLMKVVIHTSSQQYSYDITPDEFESNGTWKRAEIVLASTNPIFDEYRIDVLAGIQYLSHEIETKMK
jgi:hypothetical protein